MTIEFKYGQTKDGQNFVNPRAKLPVNIEPGKKFKVHMPLVEVGFNEVWRRVLFGDKWSMGVEINSDASNNGGVIYYEAYEKREEIVLNPGEVVSRTVHGIGFSAKHIKR